MIEVHKWEVKGIEETGGTAELSNGGKTTESLATLPGRSEYLILAHVNGITVIVDGVDTAVIGKFFTP